MCVSIAYLCGRILYIRGFFVYLHWNEHTNVYWKMMMIFFADSPFVAATVAAVAASAVAFPPPSSLSLFFDFFCFSRCACSFLWLLVRKFLQIIPNWWNRHCNCMHTYICLSVCACVRERFLIRQLYETPLNKNEITYTKTAFFSFLNWPTSVFHRSI